MTFSFYNCINGTAGSLRKGKVEPRIQLTIVPSIRHMKMAYGKVTMMEWGNKTFWTNRLSFTRFCICILESDPFFLQLSKCQWLWGIWGL
jgi:hypothetical protein